jgi:hypothetical protein
VCPTTPILCDTGQAQRVLVASGEGRRDSGPLFGAGVAYAFSEHTRLFVDYAQTLSPGSTGTLTRTNSAVARLSHQFSERLIGRLGVGYTRTRFPAGLAERWILEAGYRYVRGEYADDPSRPTSNVVFVSIAYNWPGTSFTDWVGTRFGADGFPGAGPVSLPERRAPAPGGAAPSAPPESSPFDALPIP